jgi:hypothetical protein
MMSRILWTLMSLAAAAPLVAQTPAGWKVIKDKTGACQVSIPPDWKANPQLPSLAQAPDNSDVSIIVQEGRALKPMTAIVQKAVGVDKMIENSDRRVFYSTAPTKGNPPLIGYRVTAPAKNGTCVAMITIKQGHSVDEVMKIGESLAAAK